MSEKCLKSTNIRFLIKAKNVGFDFFAEKKTIVLPSDSRVVEQILKEKARAKGR